MPTKLIWVRCDACRGRGAAIDIVEREGGKRVVVRTVCRACKGRGTIDIKSGPISDMVQE